MAHSILLADDGPAIRQVVALTFLDRDYEIVSVDNGDEALALLHQSTPDLVLADVHMPGASGYEVCRQAKMIDQQIPVLLLVGNLEPFSEAAARECGSDGMLRKPFDSKELLARVDEHLEAAAAAKLAQSEAQGTPSQTESTETSASPDQKSTQPMKTISEDPTPQGSESGSEAKDLHLSDEDVDRIARRVLQLMSKKAFEDLAWDVVPDLAEVVVRDRLRELEAQLEDLG